ncbi:hypothetical protein AAVH_34307 [Aphelenchoides avenae]|nr:hypothetical protein AAVH_34307 [Aphelenchus avenae]
MLKTPMDASLSLCARHPKLPFSACVETDQSGGFDGFSVCVGKRPGEACANFDKDVKFNGTSTCTGKGPQVCYNTDAKGAFESASVCQGVGPFDICKDVVTVDNDKK